MDHPLGCSDARTIARLTFILERKEAKYGAAATCNGGGRASTMVIERKYWTATITKFIRVGDKIRFADQFSVFSTFRPQSTFCNKFLPVKMKRATPLDILCGLCDNLQLRRISN
ncbi:hypothetical protein BD408DRAFT_193959 [Parasitella parasitica]|nr:hypothetical protein BD408DRAFT_193959 [Parasitella parasitica]